MNKTIKIVGIVIASILAVGLLFIGGYKVMQKVEYDQMVKVVKSEEAEKIFKNRLKRIDSKAFEQDGIIKTYKINYESVTHNPMGGIMVSIYVNDNKNYIFSFTLNKDSNTGKLISEGGVNDPTIIKRVEESNKK